MTERARRVAVYARVSTRDQEPETQLLPIREYIRHRGWQATEEFVDVGISGGKEQRPSLNRLMDAVRRRRVDIVLVARFDRFARSTRHLLAALEEFRVLGVDFVSLSESLDTSTAAGRVLFTVIGAFAEFERSLIRERVVAGLQRARAQGKRLGRPLAIPNGDPAALRATGLSVRAIAERLGVSKSWVSGALSKNPPRNGALAPVGGSA